MDIFQVLATLKGFAESISSTWVAVSAAAAALLAVVNHFIRPFRYLGRLLKGRTSRRREAAEVETQRRVSSCEELRDQLKALAAYYDSAALQLGEVLSLVRPETVDIHLPVEKLKDVVAKPALWIKLERLAELGIMDELLDLIKTAEKRYRSYGGLITEFQKKERAFVIQVGLLREFRSYLLKSRKQARQTSTMLDMYLALGAPRQKKPSFISLLAQRFRRAGRSGAAEGAS